MKNVRCRDCVHCYDIMKRFNYHYSRYSNKCKIENDSCEDYLTDHVGVCSKFHSLPKFVKLLRDNK